MLSKIDKLNSKLSKLDLSTVECADNERCVVVNVNETSESVGSSPVVAYYIKAYPKSNIAGLNF